MVAGRLDVEFRFVVGEKGYVEEDEVVVEVGTWLENAFCSK